jgi:hypothetical protein
MLSGNFDSEIRAAEFALHTLDTGVEVLYRNDESFHFKHLLGTELHTDVAPLAVLLDNLDSRKFVFHLLSPLV